jgi:hypothetical protein
VPHDVLAAGDPAGSDFGPTSTKSLYITGTPLHAIAFGDEFLLGRPGVHEHDIGVAPARRYRAPVPCPARLRARMPVFVSNIGSMCLNSPECSVEVVEATVMNFCALALAAANHDQPASSTATRQVLRFTSMAALLL